MAKIGTAQVTRLKIVPWSMNGFATARGGGTISVVAANDQAKPVEISARAIFAVGAAFGVDWFGNYNYRLFRVRGDVTLYQQGQSISGTAAWSLTLSSGVIDMAALANDEYRLAMSISVQATQGSANGSASGVLVAQYHKV